MYWIRLYISGLVSDDYLLDLEAANGAVTAFAMVVPCDHLGTFAAHAQVTAWNETSVDLSRKADLAFVRYRIH